MSCRSILPYIEDEKFLCIVNGIFETGQSAISKSEKSINRNVIDPFLMLFEMGSFDLSYENWLKNEKARQAQKTLSNSIGLFHQKIIGEIDGWTDLGTGGLIDVVNYERSIIAEVKNKFNTVKQSDLIGVYNGLEELVMPKMQTYKGYTSYYVEIIPKNPTRYDRCFTPPNRETGEKAVANELIRQIDGASFYELATGEKQALEMLYDAIPLAMKKLFPAMNNINISVVKKFFIQAYGET